MGSRKPSPWTVTAASWGTHSQEDRIGRGAGTRSQAQWPSKGCLNSCLRHPPHCLSVLSLVLERDARCVASSKPVSRTRRREGPLTKKTVLLASQHLGRKKEKQNHSLFPFVPTFLSWSRTPAQCLCDVDTQIFVE